MLAQLDGLAHSLAARIHRTVAVDDPTLRLLVHTPHHGPIDQTRMESILHLRAQPEVVTWVLGVLESSSEDIVRIPAQKRWEMLSRVCVPLRHAGRLLGYLWIIDEDESLTDAELDEVAAAGRAAARIMAQGGMPRDTSLVWERSILEDLLSDDVRVRTAAMRLAGTRSGVDGPLRVLAFGPLPEPPLSQDLKDALYLGLDGVAANTAHLRCLALVTDQAAVLLVPQRTGGDGAIGALAKAGRAACTRALGGTPVVTGIGEVRTGPDAVLTSYRQAVATAHVVKTTGRYGAQADWSEIGAYRFLAHHTEAAAALRDLVPDRFREMLADPAAAEIVRTVEVYLDHAGDALSSASALAIHRTSLYYRLRRFNEVCGLDLQDGDARLTLHLAFRLARLLGWTPGKPLSAPGGE